MSTVFKACMLLAMSLMGSMPIQAAVINNGEALSGSISLVGEIDEWTFSVVSQEVIRVQVAEISGSSFEPVLVLYGPDGTQLTSNIGSNSTNVSFVATTAGTYTVHVQDSSANGTGTYRIFLGSSVAPFTVPTGDEGGALLNGGVHGGSITLADMDIWNFTAQANETIRVGLGEVGNDSLTPLILIYGPDGVLISSNSGTQSSNLNVEATVAGEYRVIVQDANSDVTGTGDYQLYLMKATGGFIIPTGDEGGVLQNGAVANGSIELGDMDAFRFSANANDTVRIALAEVGNDSLQPLLLLYGPDGDLLNSNVGAVSTNLNEQLSVAGEYTVVVMDGNSDVTGSGDYQLYYTNVSQNFVVPENDEGGALLNGAIQSGSIELGDIDLWQFSAQAGDTVRIGLGEVGENAFLPHVMLYDSFGDLVTQNSGSVSADISASLTVGGTYTVVVQDGNSDVTGSGDYQLYFVNVSQSFTVPSGDQGGELTNGEVHAGNIGLADMDVWNFSANAGDTVRIGLGEIGDTSFRPFLILYDTFGELVTSNAGNVSTNVNATLEVSGNYTVIVQDGNSDVTGTGDYQLYFTNAAQSAVVPTGDEGGALVDGATHAGSIDLADMDVWTFSADANDAISLQLNEVGSTSYNPFLILYGPDGALLASDSGTASSITTSAPVAGEYTVVVQDANTDVVGVGDYELIYDLTEATNTEPSGSINATLQNGGVVSGVLTENDIDKFDFAVVANDWVRLKLADLSGSNSVSVVLNVFDSSGALVASSSANAVAQVNFKAPASETLTAVVSHNSALTASYSLFSAKSTSSFVVPSGDEGGNLTNGDVAMGTLTLGDIDLYSLNVNEGDRVRLKLGDLSGSNSTHVALLVYGANGNLVAASSANAVAQVAFKALGTEQLLVKVHKSGTPTLDYQLHTVVAPAGFVIPVDDEGGALGNGAVAMGTLTLADMDMYTLPVNSGDRVRLKLADLTGSNSTTVVMQVFSSAGSLLHTTNSNTVAQSLFIAPASEILTVVVYKSGTPTLDYQIYTAVSAQSFSVPAGDEGGALEYGVQADGHLSLGDMDLYSLNVAAGDRVMLKLADLTGSNSTHVVLQAYSAAGELVASSSSNTVAQLNYIALDTETQLIAVLKSGTPSLNYQLFNAVAAQSFSVPVGDEGGQLQNGNVANGFLSLGDIDIYSLALNEGESVRLKLGDLSGNNSATVNLQAFNSAGQLIGSSSSNTVAQLVFRAQADESVFVRVHKAGNPSLNYDLHTQVATNGFVVPASDEGGVLLDNVTASGSFTLSDLDLYAFSAFSGSTVNLLLEDLSGNNSVSVGFNLFDESGNLLASASNNTAASASYIAQYSGEYFLMVNKSGAPSATYDLLVTGIDIFDADSDGLNNAFELMLGTNRNNADTDSDGVTDFNEVNFDGDFSSYNPATDLNPLNSDTDGDGLLDGVDPNPLVANVPENNEDIPFLPIWAYLMLAVGMMYMRKRTKA